MLLQDQVRSLWDQRAIASALSLIERAAAFRRPGRFQIEAMIAALHCEASTWDKTDWPQILALYSVLVDIDSSPVVRLSRAIARLLAYTRDGDRYVVVASRAGAPA